jgi:hypothetical protein
MTQHLSLSVVGRLALARDERERRVLAGHSFGPAKDVSSSSAWSTITLTLASSGLALDSSPGTYGERWPLCARTW